MAKKKNENEQFQQVNMLLGQSFNLFYGLFKQSNAGKVALKVVEGDTASILEITLKERPKHKNETPGLSLEVSAKKDEALNIPKPEKKGEE